MLDFGNITFLWQGVLCLLPLPLIIYFLLPAVKTQKAIRLNYLPEPTMVAKSPNQIPKLLSAAIWICLVLAAARPVMYGAPLDFQPEHRDMMLVVDLSGSMRIDDMQLPNGEYTDRLSTTKRVLHTFINKRKGDRIGLVLFANHAYLQTPLTLDRQTVIKQLNNAIIGLVGKLTAIGDGIGLATKTFIDSHAPQRVIVLLSDGSNNAGVLKPIEAAKIAKKYHTTIYTIGLGRGRMMRESIFGMRVINTAADLDEKTLTQVAKITGGKYFRARDGHDLNQIYNEINRLEPVTDASQTWRPQSEWFIYPLGLALLLSIALFALRRIRG